MNAHDDILVVCRRDLVERSEQALQPLLHIHVLGAVKGREKVLPGFGSESLECRARGDARALVLEYLEYWVANNVD